MGHRFLKLIAGLAASIAVFAIFHPWLLLPATYLHYGLYFAADSAGLMPANPVGAMQIFGRYFNGPPGWLRRVVESAASVLCMTPALLCSLFVFHSIALGRRASGVNAWTRAGTAILCFELVRTLSHDAIEARTFRWLLRLCMSMGADVFMSGPAVMTSFEVGGPLLNWPLWANTAFHHAYTGLALLPALLASIATYAGLARWPAREREGPRCAKCGYLLKGLTALRCPECGHSI
jgi:hypothetical protein